MNRYTTRHEEQRTLVIWDEAKSRAVCDEGGPIVWDFAELEFVFWFTEKLNQMWTVGEIRASL